MGKTNKNKGKGSKVKEAWLQQFDKRTAKALRVVGAPQTPLRPPPVAPAPKKKAKKSNSLMPYRDTQTILVVGDGNFSWSAALCTKLSSGQNVTATSYDVEDTLKVTCTLALRLTLLLPALSGKIQRCGWICGHNSGGGRHCVVWH